MGTFTRRGEGGKRRGAGRKPKEITELHRELFDEKLARAAATKLRNKVRRGNYDAIVYALNRIFGKPTEQVAAELGGEVKIVVRYDE